MEANTEGDAMMEAAVLVIAVAFSVFASISCNLLWRAIVAWFGRGRRTAWKRRVTLTAAAISSMRGVDWDPQRLAEHSVAIADAAIAELEKTEEGTTKDT